MIELIAAAIVFAGLGILAFIVHERGNKICEGLQKNIVLLNESLKEQSVLNSEREQGNLKLQLKLEQQNHEVLCEKFVELAEEVRHLNETMSAVAEISRRQNVARNDGNNGKDIGSGTSEHLQQIVKAIDGISEKLNVPLIYTAPGNAPAPEAVAALPLPAGAAAAVKITSMPPGSGQPISEQALNPVSSLEQAGQSVLEPALNPVSSLEHNAPGPCDLADRATRLLSELASTLGTVAVPEMKEEKSAATVSFKDIEAKIDQEAVQIIEAAEKIRGVSTESEPVLNSFGTGNPDTDNAFTMATVEQPFSEAFVADGDRLFDAGKFAEAEKHYRQALPTLEEVLGRDHLAVIDILHKLAVIAYERGKYSDAANALQQIFARRVAQLGITHAETLDTLYNIGRVELRRGNFGEAENLLQQALEQRSKALGDKHRATVLAEFELALVDLYRGQVEEAYQKLLAVYGKQTEQLGPEHLDTAATAAALVQVLIAKSNLPEALAYFKQAVNVRLQFLGDEHPLVGELLGLKGLIHLKTGALLDAEAVIKRSLAIRQQSLGERHPEISQSLELRSEVLRVQGQSKEAKPFGMQALYIRKTSLGLDHLDTAASMCNLGCVLIDLKEFPEAEEMLNRSLQIVEKNFPAGHPHLGDNYLWLGVLYAAQGRHKDAQAHYMQAMEYYRRYFGDVNLGLADTLEQLTQSLLELGQPEDATKCLQAALSIRENLLGAASPLVARLVRMGTKMPAAV